MENTSPILSPESTFHIYNRANGIEKLFSTPSNYSFFMSKYLHYAIPVADTFCYCLMPNHFHFLVRIKPLKELERFFGKKIEVSETEKLVSKQFSNLFSSYTQAYNKQNNRMGSLFMKNFKRKQINTDTYLLNLVNYIHFNPVEAKLCANPELWQFSSYKDIISNAKTFLQREEIISWFGDKETFIHMHKGRSDSEF